MYGMNTTAQRDANAAKNRGTPGQWFAHTADYTSPRPQPRVQARAEATAEKYKGGESNEVLHNYRLPPDSNPPPHRIRDEDGERNAQKFMHQDDKWFDFEGNQKYQPDKQPTRVVGQRAQAIKENQDQQTGEWYEHRHKLEDADPPPKGRIPPTNKQGPAFKQRMHYNEVDWKEHAPKNSSPRDPDTAVGPRTKAEGVEYAMRSRGTASVWMAHHTVQDDHQAAHSGPLRVGTSAAAANWEKGRGQAMRDCFDYSAKEEAPRPQSGRNRRGESTAGLLQQGGGDAPPAPVATRTRPEGRANAEKNAGSLGSGFFDQQKNRDYNSPRPQARLPSNLAQTVAERNKGVMDGVLSKPEYKNPVFKKAVQPRGAGTSQAQEVAQRNKGSSAAEVIRASDMKPEPAPAPRVTAGGEQFAERNKGSVGTLFTNYGQGGPDQRPANRTRPGAAEENAAKYRGSDFFKVIQQDAPTAR